MNKKQIVRTKEKKNGREENKSNKDESNTTDLTDKTRSVVSGKDIQGQSHENS